MSRSIEELKTAEAECLAEIIALEEAVNEAEAAVWAAEDERDNAGKKLLEGQGKLKAIAQEISDSARELDAALAELCDPYGPVIGARAAS